MIRGWAFALVALLLAATPVQAQTPPPEKGDDAVDATLDKVLDKNAAPIQIYYQRAFFDEPWRLPESAAKMGHEALVVLLVDAGIYSLYRMRRRSA